ncbi:MAG: LysR family transcriptional regulator [Clostridia bacterium]|nr:LysR family transcriptional regulator [Clostridia bacterium]
MELLQLRYFLDSADNENFSKTAEKYRVPPSSVSIAVKRLETELGCTLFTRHNNKVQLNERGRVLRRAVRQALDTLDTAVADIADIRDQDSGTVSLLIRSERRIVGERLLEFKQQHPRVVFHLSHEFSSDDVDRYDIIIDASTERYPDFERQPMLSEELRFAAFCDNPLCGRRLRLCDLRDQPFVTMGGGSSLKLLVEEVCRKAGFRPHVVIESDDPYYLRKYIELDLGIALIPERSWAGELSSRIQFLEVEDFKYTRVTYAYFNKTASRSSAAFQFYRFLTEYVL